MSAWVAYEIGHAKAHDKRVLPLLTHPSIQLPGFLQSLNYKTNLLALRNYLRKTLPTSDIHNVPDFGPLISVSPISQNNGGNSSRISSLFSDLPPGQLDKTWMMTQVDNDIKGDERQGSFKISVGESIVGGKEAQWVNIHRLDSATAQGFLEKALQLVHVVSETGQLLFGDNTSFTYRGNDGTLWTVRPLLGSILCKDGTSKMWQAQQSN